MTPESRELAMQSVDVTARLLTQIPTRDAEYRWNRPGVYLTTRETARALIVRSRFESRYALANR